jgi:hypothetical protein
MPISKEAIIDLEVKLVQAIKTSDIEFLNGILHDDLLFLAPNGVVVTKAIDLNAHKAKEMVVEAIESTIESINIIDDCAAVVVVYDTKGKMLGSPIEGRFRYVRIWKSFTDGVKVIGGSCIQIK